MARDVYTPADIADIDYSRDLNDPGAFPYTRGLYRDGYRGRLWTMRQFAGFGTPAETNARYKTLLAEGGTGLSVAFDLPTLMGRDPDHSLSAGEVGKCGVSIATVEDMEALFDGIRLDEVSTSMTINGPAAAIFAMFVAVAERRGLGVGQLSGTIQNDILKEFIAQKEYIFPPRPSMRAVTDLIVYCTEAMPKWHPVSVSGYHIREAGATAAQELAFTIRDGVEYVEWAIRSGLDVDAFAPRLSFFFNAERDFFEEIAKFRAARRLWARLMRDRFGARLDRSCWLRIHAQTAGASLTAVQPYNNVVRTALQALAAVLGGTNSLHTNALDEALALPTAEAATLALRTQQVIAAETGLADVVDPFGGSWYFERLTSDLEAAATTSIEAIDRMGGMVAAVEAGFPQREIADSAYRHQQEIDRGDRVIVGVNAWRDENAAPVPTLAIDDGPETTQRAAIADVRRRRDQSRVALALTEVSRAASGTTNIIRPLVEAAHASATLGEMCDALRAAWGEYREPPAI